jgi:acetyltransferase-like isoleucine patch superfamily enzyme
MICDNRLANFNPKIKKIAECKNLNRQDTALILACTNKEIYNEIKQQAMIFWDTNKIIELPRMKEINEKKVENKKLINKEPEITVCGRYSYGPLCNHRYVKEVGSFCSFAAGSDVVVNHAIDYISTHPFIYYDKSICQCFDEYKQHKEDSWYIDLGENEKPIAKKIKVNRVKIGNDVWLGKNVLITTSVSTIGNGVIAAAGAVITKDVPDYAIVGGVPAKIIRYRYNAEQIQALNQISWWDWTDDEIRNRYTDFFIPIDDFINMYV